MKAIGNILGMRWIISFDLKMERVLLRVPYWKIIFIIGWMEVRSILESMDMLKRCDVFSNSKFENVFEHMKQREMGRLK
jgi:hypothetical protein